MLHSNSIVMLTSGLLTLVFARLTQTQRLLPAQDSSAQQPRPYNFGYEFGDGLGMTQYRHESADGTGTVKGSYGYLDPLGVYRNVEYNAGIDGYRVFTKSNEPGLSNHIAADAPYVVELPPLATFARGLQRVQIVGSPLK